jgi:3-oxoacyl-[acyl-carrier protein] reductase
MGAPRSVSLVTGGVRGLGLAIARALSERGDRVHVGWRSSHDLAADAEVRFPGRVHRADLTDGAAAQRLVEAVTLRDGRLDHLVHCVGPYASGSLEETGGEVWRSMIEGNLESAVHIFDAARSALRANGGTAVFFACAGIAELRARRHTAAYAAAKSALLVYARSLAVEEAPHGVRINTVSPGLIPHEGAHPETLDLARQAEIPLGRPGRVEEVAEAALWLSSEASSYVVGADLPVSGGWVL